MRVIAFLAILALALALQAPAWLVADRAASATGGRLSIANPTGTAWNGSGDAVLSAGTLTPQRAALGRVHWHVERIGGDGLTLGLEQIVPAATDGESPRAVVTLAPDAGRASGSIRLPATVASTLVPLAADWRFGGTCTIESEGIAWSASGIEGRARLHWRGAQLSPSASAMPLALGDIDATFEAQADGIGATWTNTGGVVALAGGIDRATRNLRLQLQPRPTTQAADLAWLPARLGPPPPAGYALALTMPPLFRR